MESVFVINEGSCAGCGTPSSHGCSCRGQRHRRHQHVENDNYPSGGALGLPADWGSVSLGSAPAHATRVVNQGPAEIVNNSGMPAGGSLAGSLDDWDFQPAVTNKHARRGGNGGRSARQSSQAQDNDGPAGGSLADMGGSDAWVFNVSPTSKLARKR